MIFVYEAEDSYIMIQDIIISDISTDDLRTEFLEINKKPEKKPQLKLQDLKGVGYGNFLNLMKITLKLHVKLVVVKKSLHGVALQVHYQHICQAHTILLKILL